MEAKQQRMDMEEGKTERVNALPGLDRCLSLKEVAMALRTRQSVVSTLIDCNLLPAIKFKRGRRMVRLFAFNKFIATADGQDISEMIRAAGGSI